MKNLNTIRNIGFLVAIAAKWINPPYLQLFVALVGAITALTAIALKFKKDKLKQHPN